MTYEERIDKIRNSLLQMGKKADPSMDVDNFNNFLDENGDDTILEAIFCKIDDLLDEYLETLNEISNEGEGEGR